MAALLEVAESEFLELRNKRAAYERSIAVQVEANVAGIPINAVSIASFVEQDQLVSKIDAALAAVLAAPNVTPTATQAEASSRIAGFAGIGTIEELREKLQKYESQIVDFARVGLPVMRRTPGSALSKGECIFRLCFLLLARKNDERMPELLKYTNPTVTEFTPEELTTLSEMARAATGE